MVLAHGLLPFSKNDWSLGFQTPLWPPIPRFWQFPLWRPRFQIPSSIMRPEKISTMDKIEGRNRGGNLRLGYPIFFPDVGRGTYWLGDDPWDRYWIERGIRYYNDNYR